MYLCSSELYTQKVDAYRLHLYVFLYSSFTRIVWVGAIRQMCYRSSIWICVCVCRMLHPFSVLSQGKWSGHQPHVPFLVSPQLKKDACLLGLPVFVLLYPREKNNVKNAKTKLKESFRAPEVISFCCRDFQKLEWCDAPSAFSLEVASPPLLDSSLHAQQTFCLLLCR